MNKLNLTDKQLNYLYSTLQLKDLELDYQIVCQKELLKKVTSIDYNGHTEPCSVKDGLDRLLDDKATLSEIIVEVENYF